MESSGGGDKKALSSTGHALKAAGVRRTKDDRASVFDLLKVAGAKSPREIWKRLAEAYPEVVTFCDNLKFPGSGQRETPVTDAKGWRRILTVLPGVLGDKYRKTINELTDLWLENPVELAAAAQDRVEDPAQLEWLGERAKARGGAIALNQAIAGAGCSEAVYAKVHDGTNVAVTGMSAREIKLHRKGKTTRDLMDTTELSLVSAAQALKTGAIKTQHLNGDGQVLTASREVDTDIAALRRKYLGRIKQPVGGFLQVDE